MATNLTYPVAPFLPFTKIVSADMNAQLNAIKSRVNWAGGTDAATGLGDDNIQSNNASGGGLTRASKLKAGTANFVVVNDGTGKMSEVAQIASTQGGLGFNPSFTGNAGQAVVVNNTETGFTLGSPLQSILTESFAGVVSSLTAGEAISALDPCCVDISRDASNATIYRIFKADSTKPNRKRSFLGFAQAAATVIAGTYTWVASANFVTSNSITFSINGRSYTVAFTTNNSTTLQAIATAMATDPDVNGAVSNGTNTVTVTGRGGLFINITGSVVTGGASQPTILVTNTQAPSGQNVLVQIIGPLVGFTSLSTTNQYYLDGITISKTPADTNPILVGQALSPTVMFINTNIGQYQFTSSTVFIRSHGSTAVTASGAQQDVEHFNFTSWSAGTTAPTKRASMSNSPSALTGLHYAVDGLDQTVSNVNTSYSYNKSAWALVASRTIAKASYASSALGNTLVLAGGTTTAVASGQVATLDVFNGTSWNNGAGTLSESKVFHTAFSQGGNVRMCGGIGATGLALSSVDAWNGASVSSATALGTAEGNGGGAACGASGVNGLVCGGYAAASKAYRWNGASWSSGITMNYQIGDADGNGCSASAFNIGNSLTYTNGGHEKVGPSSINNTQSFNDVTFAGSTASTNGRNIAQGSVL